MTLKRGAFEYDGKMVVSSHSLSRMVHKRPKDVLEVIRRVIAFRGKEFGDANFIPSEYKDKKGEMRPEFLLTRSGCDAITLELQGVKGKAFLRVYTEWFDRVGEPQNAVTIAETIGDPADLGIFIKDNVPVVSTRKIAQWFDKPHKTVLDAVRNCFVSNEPFSRQNFLPSTYSTDRGKKYNEYLVTEDGFMFLVMGFTGKKAAQVKEWFIAEFKAMKAQIKQAAIPTFSLTDPLETARQMQEILGAYIKSEETCQKLQAEKLELKAKIEADAPKVLIGNAFLITKTDVDAGTYAQILVQGGMNSLALAGRIVPMGRNNFIWWLCENKYLCRIDNGFRPIGTAKIQKLIKIHNQKVEQINEEYFKPYVTAEGQVHFLEKLLRQETERNQFKALLPYPDQLVDDAVEKLKRDKE